MRTEEMLTEVIYRFGFEHELTIMFTRAIEQNNKDLQNIFDSIMNQSIEDLQEDQSKRSSLLFSARQGTQRAEIRKDTLFKDFFLE